MVRTLLPRGLVYHTVVIPVTLACLDILALVVIQDLESVGILVIQATPDSLEYQDTPDIQDSLVFQDTLATPALVVTRD